MTSVDNVNISIARRVDNVNIYHYTLGRSFNYTKRMTNTKERYHHGDLRAALIATAAALIAEQGLESLTMRALAERVGVSRTAAYRHFADKAELLAAVAQTGFEQLLIQLQALAADPRRDRLTQLQAMGVAYIQFAVAHPTHYRLMFARGLADHQTYPALGSAGRELFTVLVTTISAGQIEGVIRRGEPRALAHVTWALVHGQASLLIEDQLADPVDADALAYLATTTLINGLRSTPAAGATAR